MDWQGQQRQRSIEIILHWQGRLNTGDLIAAFGISRIQASKDITTYRNTYPENMHYDLSKRAYLRASTFQLFQIKGTVDEYLDHIARMSIGGTAEAIARIRPHNSVLQREIISCVLNAIIGKEKQGISILYASMRQPEGSQRVIHPHSIIDTGFRWHVRAYCENRQAFRDFNLGRIMQPPIKAGTAPDCATIEFDTEWNRIVTFALIANPALSQAQQHLLEKEFDMKHGEFTLNARASLLHYTLQRYQVDPEQIKQPPTTQLLAVKEPDAVQAFLFSKPQEGKKV
ncbi:MAG: WYL domain-containing protein [Mariprofundales bacterium]